MTKLRKLSAIALMVLAVAMMAVAAEGPCNVFGRTLCPWCQCAESGKHTVTTWNGIKKVVHRSDREFL